MNTTTSTTKAYECEECGSHAVLYTNGIWQGIWECQNPDCGASGNCAHKHTHQEEAEYPRYSVDVDPEETTVSVCDDCNLSLEVF